MSLQSLLRSLRLEMGVTAPVRGSRGCPHVPTLGVPRRPCQESLSVNSPRDGYARLRPRLPSHTSCKGPSFPLGNFTSVAFPVDKTVMMLKDSCLKAVWGDGGSSSVREKHAGESVLGPGSLVHTGAKAKVTTELQPLRGSVRLLQPLRHWQNLLVNRKCTSVLFCGIWFHRVWFEQ